MNPRAKSIFVVDDNRALRKSLRVLFEASGFVCTEAENGAQGLEMAERCGRT